MLDAGIRRAESPGVGPNLVSRHNGQPREVVRSANLARVDVFLREQLAVVRDVLGGIGDGLADAPVSVRQQLLAVAKERPLLPGEGAGDRDHARQAAH